MQRVVVDGVVQSYRLRSSVVWSRVQSLVHLFSFYLLMILLTVWLSARSIPHRASHIFADDLQMDCSYDSIHDNSSIVHTIRNIERWSSLWQLRINPEKSISLQVGSAPPGQSQYVICNQIIQPSIHVSDLGLLCTTPNCVLMNILLKLLPELLNMSICCFVLLFPEMF